MLSSKLANGQLGEFEEQNSYIYVLNNNREVFNVEGTLVYSFQKWE